MKYPYFILIFPLGFGQLFAMMRSSDKNEERPSMSQVLEAAKEPQAVLGRDGNISLCGNNAMPTGCCNQINSQQTNNFSHIDPIHAAGGISNNVNSQRTTDYVIGNNQTYTEVPHSMNLQSTANLGNNQTYTEVPHSMNLQSTANLGNNINLAPREYVGSTVQQEAVIRELEKKFYEMKQACSYWQQKYADLELFIRKNSFQSDREPVPDLNSSESLYYSQQCMLSKDLHNNFYINSKKMNFIANEFVIGKKIKLTNNKDYSISYLPNCSLYEVILEKQNQIYGFFPIKFLELKGNEEKLIQFENVIGQNLYKRKFYYCFLDNLYIFILIDFYMEEVINIDYLSCISENFFFSLKGGHYYKLNEANYIQKFETRELGTIDINSLRQNPSVFVKNEFLDRIIKHKNLKFDTNNSDELIVSIYASNSVKSFNIKPYDPLNYAVNRYEYPFNDVLIYPVNTLGYADFILISKGKLSFCDRLNFCERIRFDNNEEKRFLNNLPIVSNSITKQVKVYTAMIDINQDNNKDEEKIFHYFFIAYFDNALDEFTGEIKFLYPIYYRDKKYYFVTNGIQGFFILNSDKTFSYDNNTPPGVIVSDLHKYFGFYKLREL